MSQAELDEMQKLLREMVEADNYAGVWLHRAADLHDKILRLRVAICGPKDVALHHWEIDPKGNDIVKPRSRAFCLRCGAVKYL